MEKTFTTENHTHFFYEEMPKHKEDLLLSDLFEEHEFCSYEFSVNQTCGEFPSGPSEEKINLILNYSLAYKKRENYLGNFNASSKLN